MSFLEVLQHNNSASGGTDPYTMVSGHGSDGGKFHEEMLDHSDLHADPMHYATPNHGSLVAEDHTTSDVLGLQAQADAILDTDWKIGLGDFATMSCPDVEATQAYPITISSYKAVHDFSDRTWATNNMSVGIQNWFPTYNTNNSMPMYAPNTASNPSSRYEETGQHLHADIHASANITSHGHHPIVRYNQPSTTKKSRKRRLLSSMRPRKKRQTDSTAPTESLPPSVLHAPAAPPPTPVLTSREDSRRNDLDHMNSPNRLPSNKPLTRVIQRDWVQDWENAGITHQNFNDRGITRDINVPRAQKRLMSWPLRQYIRRSLDLSVNALTKGMSKLNVERAENSPPSC